ncbi:hypothetical protein NPIL_511251 [Nephila pilipes]|uniref:Uncharacterized protein n=1 Tax=Nephila pilipes TaxID=299642 RepID=A0A8X6MQP1_NEPPI|nr:hypothetical protein NPIL_511251 [Nephila pilipes]
MENYLKASDARVFSYRNSPELSPAMVAGILREQTDRTKIKNIRTSSRKTKRLVRLRPSDRKLIERSRQKVIEQNLKAHFFGGDLMRDLDTLRNLATALVDHDNRMPIARREDSETHDSFEKICNHFISYHNPKSI